MIEWQESYSVGIAEIDEQHKGLIAIINKLAECLQQNSSNAVMDDVLDRLSIYVRDHFEYEEQLMQSVNYSDFKRHRSLHHKFSTKISGFYSQFVAGETRVEQGLLDYLSNWLIEHIAKEDQQYAAQFASSDR